VGRGGRGGVAKGRRGPKEVGRVLQATEQWYDFQEKKGGLFRKNIWEIKKGKEDRQRKRSGRKTNRGEGSRALYSLNAGTGFKKAGDKA